MEYHRCDVQGLEIEGKAVQSLGCVYTAPHTQEVHEDIRLERMQKEASKAGRRESMEYK